MVKPTGIQVFSYALFALSAVILFASFLLTMNITVIKDWKLSVPIADIHAGDTVTLVSQYTKVRDVTGTSVRYIECQNSNHIYIRYPLNEAVANRAAGHGGTGVVVKVPETIPALPTTCKFTIALEYDVYPWRKVNISQSTQSFQLLPKLATPQEVSLDALPAAQTDQARAQVTAADQSVGMVSSANNTANADPAQPNTSQPPPYDGAPTTVEHPLAATPQPLNPPTTLDKLPVIGGLFNSIGL